MKKSILALTLVAALSMLGACSSSDNNGSTGISGNAAKEPISNAKLEIWKLGEVGVTGKPLGGAITSKTGAFNFGVDPSGTYVVKFASDGLANASVMNKADGTKITNNSVTSNGFTIDSNSAIIVPANSPAQLNPMGILATQAAGIPTTGTLTKEQITNANALVSDALSNIYANLSALTLLANNNVTPQTVGSANWSANQEFAIQLALLLDDATLLDITDLVDPDALLPASIDSSIIKNAIDIANAAAKATGQSDVTRESVNEKEIIRTFFLNHDQSTPLPPQINATNATKYSINATAYGANASMSLLIAQGAITSALEVKNLLVPASSVDTSTISPANSGITVMTKTGRPGNEFGYNVTNATNGTNELVIRANYVNGTTSTSTRNTIVLNLSGSPVEDDMTSDLQP